VANPGNDLHDAEHPNCWDSLNVDVVEVTQVEVDNTIRPMRQSLRERLKLPPTLPASPEPRQEKQSP
jgi:hypothetical protein